MMTVAAGAAQAFTAPSAYMFDAQGTQHVVHVVDQNFHFYELWRDNTGWHRNDLVNATGAPELSDTSKANQPTGYVFAAQGTQHVDYAGEDSHMHELWWDSDDLTNATGAPRAALATPTGYVFAAEGTQHVDYVGEDSHMHKL
jgi:hypothetical protein